MHTSSPFVVKPSIAEDDIYVNVLDMKNTQDYGGSGCAENSEDGGVLGKPWYGGDIERKEAERRLWRINKDGCFLVRLSSAQGKLQPYTLALLCRGHIYNIPIRVLMGKGYTLGKEGKRNEKIFPTVAHLIEYYQQEQINVVNRQTHSKESTILLFPGQP
ncbi:SH2 domain-containing protein 6 [Discoglossus pictus]